MLRQKKSALKTKTDQLDSHLKADKQKFNKHEGVASALTKVKKLYKESSEELKLFCS